MGNRHFSSPFGGWGKRVATTKDLLKGKKSKKNRMRAMTGWKLDDGITFSRRLAKTTQILGLRTRPVEKGRRPALKCSDLPQ